MDAVMIQLDFHGLDDSLTNPWFESRYVSAQVENRQPCACDYIVLQKTCSVMETRPSRLEQITSGELGLPAKQNVLIVSIRVGSELLRQMQFTAPFRSGFQDCPENNLSGRLGNARLLHGSSELETLNPSPLEVSCIHFLLLVSCPSLV